MIKTFIFIVFSIAMCYGNALHNAINMKMQKKQLEVIKILVEQRNFDVNEKSEQGYTPLYLAIFKENEDKHIIEYLYSKGALLTAEEIESLSYEQKLKYQILVRDSIYVSDDYISEEIAKQQAKESFARDSIEREQFIADSTAQFAADSIAAREQFVADSIAARERFSVMKENLIKKIAEEKIDGDLYNDLIFVVTEDIKFINKIPLTSLIEINPNGEYVDEYFYYRILQFLIDKGASVNALNKQKQTPLDIVAGKYIQGANFENTVLKISYLNLTNAKFNENNWKVKGTEEEYRKRQMSLIIKFLKQGKEVTMKEIDNYIKDEDIKKIAQGRVFAKTFNQLADAYNVITPDTCSNLKNEYNAKYKQCTEGVRNTLKLAECREGYDARIKNVDICNEKIIERRETLLKKYIGRTLTFEMPNGKYYYAVDERVVWGNSCSSILEINGWYTPDCMEKQYAARFADHNTLPNITLQFRDKKQATNFEWNNQIIDCRVLGIGKRGSKYEFYCGLQNIR